jgi:hypothetical protein
LTLHKITDYGDPQADWVAPCGESFAIRGRCRGTVKLLADDTVMATAYRNDDSEATFDISAAPKLVGAWYLDGDLIEWAVV